MTSKVLVSWSSGKDSAWTLHTLRQNPNVEIVGLLTTFNEVVDRVAMHAVRRSLVEAQSAATDLPLWSVGLPSPCSNTEYEKRMQAVITKAVRKNITHVAFGDLFLEDVKKYRIKALEGTGIQPMFPIWSSPEKTEALASTMLHAGVRAVITCVDPKRLSGDIAGRYYNEELLAEFPVNVDPCGERGEFHSFCFAGPMFDSEIKVQVGKRVFRDGFHFADVLRREH